MTATIELSTDPSVFRKSIAPLQAGDRIYLSGIVYTARDAAHIRLINLLDQNKSLPFPIVDSCLYYSGATPAPEGAVIGSCGPTTSVRMDAFTPRLYDLGMAATIGKGFRSAAVVDAIRRNRGVYFCAVGGIGALIAKCVFSREPVAFEELGCEAVFRLEIEQLPLIIGIDISGKSIF